MRWGRTGRKGKYDGNLSSRKDFIKQITYQTLCQNSSQMASTASTRSTPRTPQTKYEYIPTTTHPCGLQTAPVVRNCPCNRLSGRTHRSAGPGVLPLMQQIRRRSLRPARREASRALWDCCFDNRGPWIPWVEEGVCARRGRGEGGC
jgi:hypothetical protein